MVNSTRFKKGAFIAALAAFFLAYYTYPIHTEDAIWSELIGKWVWTHHAVPTHDLWTWTSYGQNWYAQEWGFDTLLYLTNQLGGYALSAILMTAASVTTWTIIAFIAEKKNHVAPYFVTLFAAICSLAWTDYRAEVFSYLFVAILFWVIEKTYEGKGKLLIILPIIEIIWANTHGSFPFGIALVEFAAFIAIMPDSKTWWITHKQNRKVAKCLAITGALMTITALINPRTWHLYVFAIWLSTKANMPQYISEWQPTTFTSLDTALVALLVMLGILLRMMGKSKPTLYEIAMMGLLFLMFIKAIRFGSYVLLATPIFAYGHKFRDYSFSKPTIIADMLNHVKKHQVTAYNGLIASLLILSGYAIHNVHGGLMNNVQSKFNPSALQVVERIHNEHPTWKLWNEYDLGGTLELTGIPVAIDGRTDLYAPDGVLKDYVQVRNGDSGAYNKFLHYGANFVCIYKTDSLGELLNISNAWAKVYSGKFYEIYVRKGMA